MLNSLLRALRDAMRGRRASSTVASAVDAEAAAWAAADADFSAGRLDRARAGYESLVRRHPDRAEVLFRLGVIYGSSGALDEAEAVLARAEQIEPHSPDIRNARANVAWLRSDWAVAEQRFQAALELAPRNATLWANYGLCLHDAGRLPAATVAVEQALELDATHADALVNAALVQLDLGDVEAAGRHLRRALDVAPAFPEAHVLQAQCLLRRGRYAEGWAEYEWRFRCADARFRENPSLAQWDGKPDRARRVLVFAEQGLGDQIMFASCLAELSARALRSEIECDARLVGLFSRSFSQMQVHAQRPDLARPWADEAAPDAACQIHLGSLPKLFRNDARQFPQSSGYLKPDLLKVRDWADRLAGLGSGLKVGIAWRGGVPRTRQAMRSIPLAQWVPLLLAPNACFVSLQHGDSNAELTEFCHRERVNVARWPQAVEDLDEMAALVSALDLVITVCGTVVHLAGALGKPAWVLVPTCPEWRYGDAGDTMPWYASVRMFRQETPGNWQVPMQEIVRQLAQAAQPSRR